MNHLTILVPSSHCKMEGEELGESSKSGFATLIDDLGQVFQLLEIAISSSIYWG